MEVCGGPDAMAGLEPARNLVSDPAFRKARARLAAHALHHKRPEIAREAGRKGGEATSGQYRLGARAWGVAMAMRRWHGTDFSYSESRAPRAGTGGEGGGAPEPVPAPALPGKRRPDRTKVGQPRSLSRSQQKY